MLGGNAKCELCDEYTELTDHLIQEIEKFIKICPGCSKWLNKYTVLLKSYGFQTEK